MPASIFLSYASEDREAARSIGDALAKLGAEVWLDESELGGGDAWDQKIRKQIRECDYFMPIVSAHTEARHEGYFRREWRLAVERTLDMADDHPFLLPVVIDGIDEAHARVPEKFLTVQWLRVPDGRPTPALEALCRRILSGDAPDPQPTQKQTAKAAPVGSTGRSGKPPYPPFPRQEPGQPVQFWVQVFGWLARSVWTSLQRRPRWLRIMVYLWVGIFLLSRAFTPGSIHSDMSYADAEKLKAIAGEYRGSTHPADITKLASQIADEFSEDAGHHPGAADPAQQPVLAIPFSAPAGDPAAAKLADATFAQTYGRLAVSHRGRIELDKDSAAGSDSSAALARARASHAAYVLYGAVEPEGSVLVLTVTIARADDGSIVWNAWFPAPSADPVRIAEEVNTKIPPTTARPTSTPP
ncbi:MAG TPA: toll/interleukin-1 receptor domain-containing protein [Steroidobacteraceae bacterium]|nr:toll/interleukin-1 receptor domain-containing protein [Steroidobacteraceae bacterium]